MMKMKYFIQKSRIDTAKTCFLIRVNLKLYKYSSKEAEFCAKTQKNLCHILFFLLEESVCQTNIIKSYETQR